MRVATQLSVFLENRPGVLAEVATDLARHGISIRALTVANLVDHSVVRLVVSEPQKALHLLGDRGVLVVTSSVLALFSRPWGDCWVPLAARRRRLRMGADGGASGGDADGRRGRRLKSGVGQVVHPKLSS